MAPRTQTLTGAPLETADQNELVHPASQRESDLRQARTLAALAEAAKAQMTCGEEARQAQVLRASLSEAQAAALFQSPEILQLRTKLTRLQAELAVQGQKAMALAERRDHTAQLYERATAGIAQRMHILGRLFPHS